MNEWSHLEILSGNLKHLEPSAIAVRYHLESIPRYMLYGIVDNAMAHEGRA